MTEAATAVICMAHLGDPRGVLRLASFLNRAGAHLYVHVDAKVSAAPYEQALAGHPGATLAEDRTAIHWLGFSFVQATVRTLRSCIANPHHRRFCLISEDSAPLVSAATFRCLMDEPVEYIRLAPHEDDPLMQRYRGFYMPDSVATNPRSTPEARIVDPGLLGHLQRLEALRARGKHPLVRLFHGSAWWALTRRAVDRILTTFDADVHLRESFEFSFNPDEQYLQTILGEAPENFRCVPFLYADFNRSPRPYVFHTADELQALRARPFLFTRKVALGSPSIDEYLARLAAE